MYQTRDVREEQGNGGEGVVYVTTFLYALLILPLHVSARLDIGERSTVQIKLRALFWTLRFDGVIERGESGLFFSIRPRGKGGEEGSPITVPARALIRPVLQNRRARAYIARHVRVHRLTAKTRIGMEEAASTARICGLLSCMLAPLARLMQRKLRVTPHFRVAPDFTRPLFLLSAQCIIVALPGDIMATAALGILHNMKRKARQAILLRRGLAASSRAASSG